MEGAQRPQASFSERVGVRMKPVNSKTLLEALTGFSLDPTRRGKKLIICRVPPRELHILAERTRAVEAKKNPLDLKEMGLRSP